MSDLERVDELAAEVKRLRWGSYGASVALFIAFVVPTALTVLLNYGVKNNVGAKLSELETKLGALEKLGGRAGTGGLGQRLSRLETGLSTLETELTGGPFGNGGLRHKLSELETGLSTLETELTGGVFGSGLRQKLSELERRVDQLRRLP